MIYLIGSLRNPRMALVSQRLRLEGFSVFDDWYAAGPEADDKWRDYEKMRGRNYREGLYGAAATNVFEFDLKHLKHSAAAVLVMPAGKSGHLELGWVLGQGKPGFVLFPDGEPERWDVMYRFATDVVFSLNALVKSLHGEDLPF